MSLERRKNQAKAKRVLVEVSAVYNPLLIEVAFMENQCADNMQVSTKRAWELGSYIYIKSAAGDLKTKAKVVSCTAQDSGSFILDLNVLR